MVGLFVFAFAQLSRFPDTVINFRTQMTTSYAELGETCVATTAQLGIVIFFCCALATPRLRFAQLCQFRSCVMPELHWMRPWRNAVVS